MKYSHRQGCKGFTLIELLVVISIIALLLSIMMPSLMKAKELARAVVCSSRQKQWLTAAEMFSNDNKGIISDCIELAPPYTRYKEGFWFYQWAPYLSADAFVKQTQQTANSTTADIDDIEILYCPSAMKKSNKIYSAQYQMYFGDKTHAWAYEGFEGGFCINSWVEKNIENVFTIYQQSGFKERLMNKPYQWAKSDIPILSDGSWMQAMVQGEQVLPPHANGPETITELNTQPYRVYLERHGNSVNVVYGDMHAEKVKLDDLLGPDNKWHQGWKQYYHQRPR